MIIFFLVLILSSSVFSQDTVFKNFITAKDGKLWDGGKEFRFISFNIPNLNYVEDEFAFNQKHPYRMPDTFEMTDAMESIKQLGGQVIRNYTFPVRNNNEEPYPTYILAPNTFDEESFKTTDTLLALANKIGVRVILPFVNCWQWMGGRPQYASFRGKTEEEFWTDPQLIEDIKATINFVVNRKNTVTGITYKDDKSILCWETGNELTAPFSWTQTITRFIKSIDENHLIMDGFNAINNTKIFEEALNEPSIDIVTTHHYEENPAEFIENLQMHLNHIDNKKVYVVGEFGFMGTPAIEAALNLIIDNNVAGALIWSLRYHRKEGGFYWHSEPLGMGIYKAYHWPGFHSGDEYDERNMLVLMQKKAFEIQGLDIPQMEPPKAPKLLPINEVSQISWQGSAGAGYYDVERSESRYDGWRIIGFNVTDADAQYFPLFHDVTAEPGRIYFYRVLAKNSAGRSSPSNVIGPVAVSRKCLIDNSINFGTMFHKSGSVALAADNDRVFREKMFRLTGEEKAEIIYFVDGSINECNVFAFSEADETSLEFLVSNDNIQYSKVEFNRSSLFSGKGDYGYWVPCVYNNLFPAAYQFKYLKIVFVKKTQLSRVELFYN